VAGMTHWLHTNGFSYKQPKGSPSKADAEKQQEFIDFYGDLQKNVPEEEPIEFGDGVHPTMATKLGHGWIRTGKDKVGPTAPKIHLILDQGPYNKSSETKEAAENYGIKLHFLSPYSPNLNPLERLWKVMNEQVRNNVFFKSFSEFRAAILGFFEKKWPQISMSMVDRINDSFSPIKSASSI
jgi:transposase